MGIKEIGCEVAEPTTDKKVANLLNSSWQQFWQDPEGFNIWEKKTLDDFKNNLG